MKRLITIILLLGSAGAARAVPVVPNFQQGSMTSHTETESTVTETIIPLIIGQDGNTQ